MMIVFAFFSLMTARYRDRNRNARNGVLYYAVVAYLSRTAVTDKRAYEGLMICIKSGLETQLGLLQ